MKFNDLLDITEEGQADDLSNALIKLATKPDADSTLAIKFVKVGWRKKTADTAGILKHVDKYLQKLKKLADENKDNLSGLAF